MSSKKGKIEIEFNEAGKVKKLTYGEDIPTSKVLELIKGLDKSENDYSDNLVPENKIQKAQKNESLDLEDLSIMDKLMILIKQIKYGWFTTKDIQDLYQNEYGGTVGISTISTYLSRLYAEKILDRRGSRKRREFQLITEKLKQIPYIEDE